ncbi:MAG TPA: sigma-70 family RNA polymerase sigma factor [Pirellulaceae bacterium]|nr:sigma-70 family RNA polymerase sigma factor [Pirellulaceae bacterium]
MTDTPVFIDKESGTSTGLLRRAVLRQPDAWDKLVSLYGPLVYRWCRRWGLQPRDAENVGQEVFVRVLLGLPKLQIDGANRSFRGWLFRIARNCFLDHIRDQRTVVQGAGGSTGQEWLEQVPAAAVSDESESATSHEDNNILIQQALGLIRGEFSDRDWNAFSQVVMQGRLPADVAADMNISTNVVYLVKSRVLRRLREEFAELVEF